MTSGYARCFFMGKGGSELQNAIEYAISVYGRERRISVRFLSFFIQKQEEIRMEGKNSCEEKSKFVCLTAEQMKQMLTPFYETVASAAGYEVEQEDVFDCTRVNVAANVQENIIAAYQEKDASLEKSSVISVLLMAGPKVDAGLPDNTVEIFDGYICKKEGA